MTFFSSDITNITNSFVNPSKKSATADPSLDANNFLTLLVKQLQNQDPLAPTDQQQFLGDLAQFNLVQQSVDLNAAFLHFMQFQELTQASSMIGKHIIALSSGSGGDVVSSEGDVVEVFFTTSGAILKLDDDTEVPLQDVVNVKSAG